MADDPISKILEDIREEISRSNRDRDKVQAWDQKRSDEMMDYFKGTLHRDTSKPVTEAAIKEVLQVIKDFYDRQGVHFGTLYSNFERSFKRESLANKDNIGNVENLIQAAMRGAQSLLSYSERAEARGEKDVPMKGVHGNKKLNEHLKEIRKGMVSGLTLISQMQRGIIGFFKELPEKTQKALKKLGEDLVEGLEKSKFVGGVMRDTFRLLGLMGASWLSRFGQLGRIFGGAFYVVMSTVGPSLVNLLLKGLGKILLNLPWGKLLQGLGKGIGAFGVGNLIGVGAGVAGSIWAFNEASDSWQQGRKGNATAFGIGGTGMALGAGALGLAGAASLGSAAMGGAAAGGIAATLSGIAAALGPIGWTLLAIGAAVAGIAFLWKKFGKDIQQHYKDNKDFYDNWFNNILHALLPITFLKDAWDWIKDRFGIGGSSSASTSSRYNEQDKTAVQHIAGMGVNKAGGVIGVEKLDKMTASKVAETYFSQYPERANNAYERVGSKYASLVDFQNDWAIRDEKGNAKEAILYKGASQDLEDMWAALVSSGAMTKERAELMKFTSGRSTLSSPHVKGGTHENIMNMVTDLGSASWTDAEWEAAMKVLKPMLADKGFNLKWEGKRADGSTYFGDNFVAGLTNRHFHVETLPNAETSKGAKENIENFEKEDAEKYGQVKAIVSKIEPEIEDKIQLELAADEELRKNILGIPTRDRISYEEAQKKVLKDMGYEINENTGAIIKHDKKGNYYSVIEGPDGNLSLKNLLETGNNYNALGTSGWNR